jgi:class 3 adenylate cyclase
MILLAAVLVIVRPSAVAAAAQVAGTLITWALTATGGGRVPFAATPAEAVMLGAMAVLCAGTWFFARARDRAAFCTAQSLADSWRTRLRVLTAALPLEIVPALVDHFDKAGAWSGAPATAALDVSIVFLRLPPLAHALFPRAPAAAVARLGELWAVVDAAFAASGVATLEVTDTEIVGVVGLGGGGGDAATTVSAALAALAALPPDFAAAAVAGVNSGPVVCGFVGENRPRFTLVGDTMNTASRLATAAPPGKVTVSAAVRARTVGNFDAVERVAHLKGKGDVAVFDVVGDSRASPSGSSLTVRSGGGGFSVRSGSADLLVRSADDVGLTVGAAAGPSSGVAAETSFASADDDAALVGAAGAAAPAGRPSTPAFSARFAPKPFSIFGFADAAVEARFSARARQSGARYMIALFAFLALFVLLSGSPIAPSAPGVATNIAGAVFFFAVAAAVAVLPESSPAAAAAIRAAYVVALAFVPLVAQRVSTAVLATCFLVAIPLDTLPALRVIALTAASCALVTVLWRAGFYAEELATPAWPGPGSSAWGLAIVAWVWIGFCVSSMGALLMDATERALWAAADALVAVQGAGGAVLAALLPRPLIARLAAGADVAALTQEADGVALLCADISGFTALSASAASPARVFELLNDAFRDFERVAHAEGCEKIKTCGDVRLINAHDAALPAAHVTATLTTLHSTLRATHDPKPTGHHLRGRAARRARPRARPRRPRGAPEARRARHARGGRPARAAPARGHRHWARRVGRPQYKRLRICTFNALNAAPARCARN